MSIDKEKILDNVQKYILKGQPKKAVAEYLSLIEASPKDKRLYLKLGDLYLKIGENQKAIEEYLKLADLYVEDDLNFRAIAIYKRILSINPKHIEAFHKIPQLYLKEGLVGNAKNYYQSILEIKPNDREALDALKRIETNQKPKEAQKAIPSTESAIQKHRHPPKKESIEKESIEKESQLLRSSPIESEITSSDKDSEMHYHLGIAYKEMGLYDEAISEFELVSTDPLMKFDCYTMLGSCYMEKGDYHKSIEYYRMASGIRGLSDKKLAWLQFHLGLAYEGKGMVSEALNIFKNVLNLDHSFSEAKEKIKKLQ